MRPQITYINSDEELVVNYTISERFWSESEIENIDQLNLYVGDPETKIEIIDIGISVRTSEK